MDRELIGFVVIDYSENPAGVKVYGPTSAQNCSRFMRNTNIVRRTRFEVEGAYTAVGTEF